MSAYEVHVPRNIREAVGLMASLKDAYFVAGGTKLMSLVKQKKVVPKHLISLKDLEDFRHISQTNGLRLGSSATLSEVERDEVIIRQYTALFDAVCNLGPPKIRATATVGGTICNVKPNMHLACSLLLFDPDVAIAGMSAPTHQYGMEGKGGFLYGRFMGIEGFFLEGTMGAVRREELVKEFVLVPSRRPVGSVYIKIGQKKAEDLGISGVGVKVEVSTAEDLSLSGETLKNMTDLSDMLAFLQKSGLTFEDARIVAGRPVEAPIRMRDTERIVKGQVLCNALLDAVDSVAVNEVTPRTAPGVDRWYGKEILKTLLKRAIKKAVDRAIRQDEGIRPEKAW